MSLSVTPGHSRELTWKSDAPPRTALTATTRDLAIIAGCAVLLHLLVFAAAARLHPWTLKQFAQLRDGGSYINVAKAMLGDAGAMSPYDRRVFLGYPALIALASSFGIASESAALLINWLATGASAAAAAVLFRDRRVGWAMACLTPSYLMYTSMAMSEATLLAITLCGLVCVQRHREGLGGAVLGLAGLIRPMACFAVLGAATATMSRRWQRALAVCAASAVVVAIGFLAQQRWTGDALRGVAVYAHDDRAYAGQLFAAPFESLIMTPLRYQVPLWKTAYVWLTTIATIVACWSVSTEALGPFSRERELARLAAPWLVGNTLFTLVVGHIWGFHEYHCQRYCGLIVVSIQCAW
jgi:hypothetical protein